MSSSYRGRELYKNYLNFKDIISQIDWLESVNKKDIEAMEEYTTAMGYDINIALREDEELAKKRFQSINVLDNLFLEIPPINTSIKLWRSVDILFRESFADNAFISTTSDLFTIYKHLEKQSSNSIYILEITVCSGSKILPVASYSNSVNELEIVLERNGQFQFVNETINDQGQKFIHLIYSPYKTINFSTGKEILTFDKILIKQYNIIVKQLNDNLHELKEEIELLEGDQQMFNVLISQWIDERIEKLKFHPVIKNLVLQSESKNLILT